MNQILREILEIQEWENKYNTFARKNNLNSVNSRLIKEQNFENFQNFIEAIVQKGPRKSKKRWVSNQRRILHILLNCISVLRNISVQQFVKFEFYTKKNQEILEINRVFPYKDKYSIEYQLRKLSISSKQNRRRWSEKQENILQDIVKKIQNKNKWNQIARELFITSKGEYFRQGKHCRERFFKLKQDKGQLSHDNESQSHIESEEKNSSQFQSRSIAKSSGKHDFLAQNIQKIQKANFHNINIQKQSDYNYSPINSGLQCQVAQVMIPRLQKSIKYHSRDDKHTQLSSQQEKNHFNQLKSQSDKNNGKEEQKNSEKVFQSQKQLNPVQIIEIEGKNIDNSGDKRSQKMHEGFMYDSFMLTLQNPEVNMTNNILGLMWFNPVTFWTINGYPFNCQRFY